MSQLRGVMVRLLLAVGLTFALWVYVTFNENPDQTTSFQEVPVRIEGMSPGLVLVDERGLPLPTDTLPLKLDQVVVQADTQTLANLNRSDIDAYIDLAGLSPGDYTRPVLTQSRRPNLRLRFVEASPDFVPIRLEALVTATVPLSLVVEGNVPFVYERGDPALVGASAGLTTAQVSGPEGLVGQVVEARAVADIDGLTGSFESSLALQPLDAAGQAVEGVSVAPAEIEVSVPINPSVGIKPVAVTAPPVIGTPAPGFQVTAIRVDPPFVNITGSSQSLAEVTGITTQPMDIGGASGSLTRELALQVPEGVSLVADAPRRVLVTVEVAPVDRPLSFSSPLPVEVIDIGGGVLLRSASPATLLVNLQTSVGSAAGLDLSQARAVVDVGGLGPGTYQLRPVLELPTGVRVVGEVSEVTVTLVAPTQPRPTAQAPAPTPTEAPGEPPTTTPASTPATPDAALTPTEAPPAEPTSAATPTEAPPAETASPEVTLEGEQHSPEQPPPTTP